MSGSRDGYVLGHYLNLCEIMKLDMGQSISRNVNVHYL